MKTKKHLSPDLKSGILKAIKAGITIEHLSKIHKIHRVTIHRWIREQRSGVNIKDGRRPGSGRRSKICGQTEKDLIKIINQPATRFGFETDLWDTKRIVIICKKNLDLKLSHMAVWRFLTKIEYSCKKVQKKYKEADEGKKNLWLKNKVKEIKTMVTKRRAILYFEDESNISLSPVMGTTWAPKGKKAYSYVTGNRGSISVISAISSDGRLIFRSFNGNKRFNSDDIIDFFKAMLARHPRRHLVVVMDQATCHKSNKTKDFIKSQRRLHVYWLPSKSPEFNPDEQVWNHLKNVELKSHQETTIKGLKRLVNKKLTGLSKSETKLMGIFKRCEIAPLYLR